MISIEDVLKIHNTAIEQFGGKKNIRDLSLLESALSRPFATFDGNDLYPTILEKVAAISESIIKNHPFYDGNKRIGYLLLRILLRKNGFDLSADQDEKYSFIISIAKGKLNFDDIVSWLKANTYIIDNSSSS